MTELPCITPIYNIPTKPGGSNHTLDFAESAKAIEAHEATMTTSKSLAATAIRVLTDTEFYNSVRSHLFVRAEEKKLRRHGISL
jgi:hypothetical protein